MRPKAKYAVIYRHRSEYPISIMCKFFGVSRSGYYDFVKRLGQPEKDADLSKEIQICQDTTDKTYGYRRVWLWLEHKEIHRNPKTVLRVMKKYGLLSEIRRRRKWVNLGQQVHKYKNLLARQFRADRPNTKWVTDITEFKISGRKIYFSPILDLYNQEIISYTIFEKPEIFSVIQMLDEACKKVSAKNIILHTDNGWQYKTYLFRKIAQHHGIIQSMSRPGKCHDNAVIENFFGTVKKEFVYNKNISIKEFKQKLSEYIFYYNTKRIKNKFKMSPIEYKNMDYKKAKIKLCALS